MNQKTRILVLAVAKPYDMIPEGSLERVSGCAMHYVITDDVSRDQFDEDTGEVGYIPAKEKMPKEFYEIAKAQGLPAYADAVFGMKSSGGKNVFVIKSLILSRQKHLQHQKKQQPRQQRQQNRSKDAHRRPFS